MMKAISLLLVLLLHQKAANAIPVTRSVVHSVSRRSAEYDDYLARQERDATNQCTWKTSRLRCWIQFESYTKYDELGRRESKYLADALDQGRCGSCWSVASAGTYTDLRNLAVRRKLPNISPQHMTTCETKKGYIENGNGCCGGSYTYAAYIFKCKGATTTNCLKYTLDDYLPENIGSNSEAGKNFKQRNPLICPNVCDDNTALNLESLHIVDYKITRNPTETEIIEALKRGPIIAGMNITDEFQTYACGIFCASPISHFRGRHAVEIVDYGRDTNAGVDFYVVKNSRGASWGENGYFRIRRGDLGLGRRDDQPGYDIVELTVSSQGKKKRASDTPCSSPLPPVSPLMCGTHEVNDPTADEVVMIVANFAIEELNDLNSNHSLILCPDNTTTAGQITLSTVTNATTQVVDGTLFNISMMVEVDGCCLTGAIDATITAEVFRDGNGTFSLSAYTYSTGAALRVSLLLVFAVMAVVMLLQ